MKTIIINQKERNSVLEMYFYGITLKALENFSKRMGYGDDFMSITFKEEMSPIWEWEKELSEINDRQVLLWAQYPAISEENSETNLYLNYEEFYAYLVKTVIEKTEESLEEGKKYKILLSKIKLVLNL